MTISALNNLVTVEQLAKKYPQLTIGGIRWWIFHRKTNNLQDSKAIIKIGRKIFIDETRFIDWLYKNKVQ